MTELPGKPGPKLREVWKALTERQRKALLPHLTGGTSAETLALALTEDGPIPIGQTSLKSYLRTLRQEGV